MNTTYETKNKEQGMSDPNENKPGYKKTRMDGIPEGHIISDPVADAIDYSRDAMHRVSTINSVCKKYDQETIIYNHV